MSITKYCYSDGTAEYAFEQNPNKILHSTKIAGITTSAVLNDNVTMYYFMGKLHRTDSPAVFSFDNNGNLIAAIWFFNGIQINCKTQSEFDKEVFELIKNKKNVNKVKVGLKRFVYTNNNLKEE